jgi:protein-tyrosine-phosphatase
MMNLVIFICPENKHLSKYCEAFYNHIHNGYLKKKPAYTYQAPSLPKKIAHSRLSKNKMSKDKVQMRATDPALERIYQKIITNQCYDFGYRKITDEDIDTADLIIYMTDREHPKALPGYLMNGKTPKITWNISNIKKETTAKYNLLESLIRKMLKKS